MNLTTNNMLTITGPNTNAVIKALNGGQHMGEDRDPLAVYEVYFDPERIIPTPEGLDEVQKDEIGQTEQDIWRLRNWGAYRVYRDSQYIDTATSGEAVIYFPTLYGPAGWLIAALSSKFPDHQFLLWCCPETVCARGLTYLFVDGVFIEFHDLSAEFDDLDAEAHDLDAEAGARWADVDVDPLNELPQ